MSTLRDSLVASLTALTLTLIPASSNAEQELEDVGQAPEPEIATPEPAPAASVDTPAVAEPNAIEELIVTGRFRDVATDIVAERQQRAVVADFLSADDIARTGDTTVAAALRRIPGVTLVADKFIYVRGLGERYSSSQLNGAEVPSPDLSRDVLPLDIFPATILDSLVVQKGYAPDRPAAFGGGDINIRTKGVPAGPVVRVEVGTGWNSESSDDGISYDGGDSDWLGTDDGTREFPGALSRALGEFQGSISPASKHR
ncbi:MAG: TonB-dependent receptor plug domain-containing protein [Gammaproteobacteria bacterium]|jgi:outer membrane receptor protein involved in Fe transport